jgi:hypothetical protein
MAATDAPVAPPEEVPATPATDGRPAIAIGHGALLKALEQSLRDNSVSVGVAGVGTVRLPALDSLAWLGGLAALAALGIVDWPIAAVIGVGHVLSHQQHLRLLSDFGQALESA